jgi:hypothetical protein
MLPQATRKRSRTAPCFCGVAAPARWRRSPFSYLVAPELRFTKWFSKVFPAHRTVATMLFPRLRWRRRARMLVRVSSMRVALSVEPEGLGGICRCGRASGEGRGTERCPRAAPRPARRRFPRDASGPLRRSRADHVDRWQRGLGRGITAKTKQAEQTTT